VISRTRLLAVARKELVQLTRDPRSLILAFLLPVFLLVMFGYAITWDVSDIRIVVVDQDRSARSRELVDAFAASGYFRIAGRLERAADVPPWFDRGQARLGLVIPPGFERDLRHGHGAPLQALVDGSDANTATITLAYARATVQSWAQRALTPGRSMRLPLIAESRVWYNEELVSRNMIVPGLVATIMMIIAAMLTALTIAREWERGTMEQLAATPVSRLEVVLGKLLPYLGIGLLDVTLTSVLGVAIFGVPFRGSVLLLAGLSVLFLTGALGLGIFISAVAKSQLLATQVALVATFLPAFLLSGFMFSISNMTRPLQVITHIIPARYFVAILKGLFLKGSTVRFLYAEALFLLVFGIVTFAVANRKFKKRLG
jgi:ABC-2 type transport system permease protein